MGKLYIDYNSYAAAMPHSEAELWLAATWDDTMGHAVRGSERWAELYLGISISEKTIVAWFKEWPETGVFTVPVGGISAVASIEYQDVNEANQALDVGHFFYVEDLKSFEIYPKDSFYDSVSPNYGSLSERQTHPIKVTYTAGANWEFIDPAIKMAMFLKLKHWWVNRADSMLTNSQYQDIRTAAELLDMVLREMND